MSVSLRSVSEIIRLCSISFVFSQLHVSCHEKCVLCISYTQRIFIVGIENDGQRKRDGETDKQTDRQTDRRTETDGQSIHRLFVGRTERERREMFIIRFFYYY